MSNHTTSTQQCLFVSLGSGLTPRDIDHSFGGAQLFARPLNRFSVKPGGGKRHLSWKFTLLTKKND